IIRQMDRHFGASHYSLKSLFRDEQTRILNQILTAAREDIHASYRHIADRFAPLTRFLADLHWPVLKGLNVAMEIVVNSELRHQFDSDQLDVERVRSLLAECEASKIPLAVDELAYAFAGHMDRLSDRFDQSSDEIEVLDRFVNATTLARALPF